MALEMPALARYFLYAATLILTCLYMYRKELDMERTGWPGRWEGLSDHKFPDLKVTLPLTICVVAIIADEPSNIYLAVIGVMVWAALYRTFIFIGALIAAIASWPFAGFRFHVPNAMVMMGGTCSASEIVSSVATALQQPSTKVPPLMRASFLYVEPRVALGALKSEFVSSNWSPIRRKSIADCIPALGFFCSDEEIVSAELARAEGNESPYDLLMMQCIARSQEFQADWERFRIEAEKTHPSVASSSETSSQ